MTVVLLGRGVRSFYEGSPAWVLRDTHLAVIEGIAIPMRRPAGDAEWLERVAGVAASEVGAISDVAAL